MNVTIKTKTVRLALNCTNILQQLQSLWIALGTDFLEKTISSTESFFFPSYRVLLLLVMAAQWSKCFGVSASHYFHCSCLRGNDALKKKKKSHMARKIDIIPATLHLTKCTLYLCILPEKLITFIY